LAGFADPGPMLRRTLCHNVNRALGRAKIVLQHNPPESGQIAQSGGMSAAPQQKALLFDALPQIEIHDVADAVDIDTARGNVSGDQRKHLPLAKCGKHPFALVLRLVAVDRVG